MHAHPKGIGITRVTDDDFDDLIRLIHALADFEKLSPPDDAALERLRRDAFADPPRFESFIVRAANSQAIGYMMTFYSYSSFRAQRTLYLEDLFILPKWRSQGIGRECMMFLIRRAAENECGRVEWQVLDWNVNAVKFYDAIGAQHMREWYPYRISAEQFSSILDAHNRHE